MSRLRLVLAVSGLAAALLTVVSGDRRVGWLSITLLLASLLLRILQRKSAHGHRDDESEPR